MPLARPGLPGRTPFEKTVAAFFLLAVHTAPLVAIATGTTRADWITFAAVHVMLALLVGTGLHRYFAHHAFRTSRPFQLLLGAATCLTFTDPIGFAGKHRIHHRYSDTDDDVHTPHDGWWSCWLWSYASDGLTDRQVREAVPDLMRYPELALLHRVFWLPGLVFGAALFAWGGFARLAIGYALAVAVLLHFTSAVNYVCHRWGTRRFETGDDSRNNWLVALITWGEGWHNNHHYYPASARAGFYWWELDANYWLIRLLAAIGLVWDVREVPERVLREGREQPA